MGANASFQGDQKLSALNQHKRSPWGVWEVSISPYYESNDLCQETTLAFSLVATNLGLSSCLLTTILISPHQHGQQLIVHEHLASPGLVTTALVNSREEDRLGGGGERRILISVGGGGLTSLYHSEFIDLETKAHHQVM